MKRVFLTILLTSSSYAQIYECTSNDNRLSYSDKPCPKSSIENVIKTKKTSWVDQLRTNKPSSIIIHNIETINGDTIMKFNFSSQEDVKLLMRLTHKLSNMPVTLLKITASENNTKNAIIKVSKKTHPIFDK